MPRLPDIPFAALNHGGFIRVPDFPPLRMVSVKFAGDVPKRIPFFDGICFG